MFDQMSSDDESPSKKLKKVILSEASDSDSADDSDEGEKEDENDADVSESESEIEGFDLKYYLDRTKAFFNFETMRMAYPNHDAFKPRTSVMFFNMVSRQYELSTNFGKFMNEMNEIFAKMFVAATFSVRNSPVRDGTFVPVSIDLAGDPYVVKIGSGADAALTKDKGFASTDEYVFTACESDWKWQRFVYCGLLMDMIRLMEFRNMEKYGKFPFKTKLDFFFVILSTGLTSQKHVEQGATDGIKVVLGFRKDFIRVIEYPGHFSTF